MNPSKNSPTVSETGQKRSEIGQKIPYPTETLEKARRLYLEGKPLKTISETCKMQLPALKYHVGKRWKSERIAIKSELIEAMTEDKRIDLMEITAHGLTFLKNALKSLMEKDNASTNPSLLKTISTIVFEINKIKALDEGRPTEIMAEIKPASIIEIKELLSKDPFMEIEDANVVPNTDDDLVQSESSGLNSPDSPE